MPADGATGGGQDGPGVVGGAVALTAAFKMPVWQLLSFDAAGTDAGDDGGCCTSCTQVSAVRTTRKVESKASLADGGCVHEWDSHAAATRAAKAAVLALVALAKGGSGGGARNLLILSLLEPAGAVKRTRDRDPFGTSGDDLEDDFEDDAGAADEGGSDGEDSGPAGDDAGRGEQDGRDASAGALQPGAGDPGSDSDSDSLSDGSGATDDRGTVVPAGGAGKGGPKPWYYALHVPGRRGGYGVFSDYDLAASHGAQGGKGNFNKKFRDFAEAAFKAVFRCPGAHCPRFPQDLDRWFPFDGRSSASPFARGGPAAPADGPAMRRAPPHRAAQPSAAPQAQLDERTGGAGEGGGATSQGSSSSPAIGGVHTFTAGEAVHVWWEDPDDEDDGGAYYPATILALGGGDGTNAPPFYVVKYDDGLLEEVPADSPDRHIKRRKAKKLLEAPADGGGANRPPEPPPPNGGGGSASGGKSAGKRTAGRNGGSGRRKSVGGTGGSHGAPRSRRARGNPVRCDCRPGMAMLLGPPSDGRRHSVLPPPPTVHKQRQPQWA